MKTTTQIDIFKAMNPDAVPVLELTKQDDGMFVLDLTLDDCDSIGVNSVVIYCNDHNSEVPLADQAKFLERLSVQLQRASSLCVEHSIGLRDQARREKLDANVGQTQTQE